MLAGAVVEADAGEGGEGAGGEVGGAAALDGERDVVEDAGGAGRSR